MDRPESLLSMMREERMVRSVGKLPVKHVEIYVGSWFAEGGGVVVDAWRKDVV